MGPMGITAMLDAAIRLSGKIVGAFCVEHMGGQRTWTTDEVAFGGEVADQIAQAIMNHRRVEAERALRQAETKVRALNADLEKRVVERTEELNRAQQELIEKARRAGMADIATSVLHNVGNILTSVLTSGQTIEKSVKSSSLRSMKKANQLLQEVVDKANPKSESLVEYYDILEDLLNKEQSDISENVDQVLKKIDLIRDVIMAQQSFAAADSLSEAVDLVDIVEDALDIQDHAQGHDIILVREFEPLPKVVVQKIKIIHVVINLIKNAREAMSFPGIEERRLTLQLRRDVDYCYLNVVDTGVGIPQDHLDRIFTHGFSTKHSGHGFGLHSCANAMKEMSGAISVTSEGEGKGATFTLKFPIPDPASIFDTFDQETTIQ